MKRANRSTSEVLSDMVSIIARNLADGLLTEEGLFSNDFRDLMADSLIVTQNIDGMTTKETAECLAIHTIYTRAMTILEERNNAETQG
jgi:hypothetical protein